MTKKLIIFLLILTWSSSAAAFKIRQRDFRINIGGAIGFHFFDKDQDLYSVKNLSSSDYGNYPGHMVLFGAILGVDFHSFTLETNLDFIPSSLEKTGDFAPVMLLTLSGLYRFKNLLPKRFRITPFIKLSSGTIGIWGNSDVVKKDGDLIFGPGIGAIYQISDSLTARLDLNYFVTDAVQNVVANNFQVKASFFWSFDLDKDTDKDTIFDSVDKCPTQKEDFDGYMDSDGCPDPDNDNDGIKDKVDKCPGKDADISSRFVNTKEDKDGFDDTDGCPDLDNDNDGIKDGKDKCPGTDKDKDNNFTSVKEDKDGFKDSDGCPDLDNDMDGVVDTKDKCPGTEKDIATKFISTKEDKDGFDDADGCPDLDNDNDGIKDVNDKCKGTDKDKDNNFANTKEDMDGFDDNDGCPDWDNDHDGVYDSQDQCPGTEKDKADNFIKTKEIINGYKDNDGCPDKHGKVKVIVLKEKIKILDRVYFKFNKSTIRRRSYSLLRQIALTIKAHSQIKKLEIQGHTGTIGNADHNMTLSQKRANSVKQFLIDNGVSPSMLIAKGYGEEKPIKKCSRIRSRRRRRRCESKNRRVEFIIKTQN